MFGRYLVKQESILALIRIIIADWKVPFNYEKKKKKKTRREGIESKVFLCKLVKRYTLLDPFVR